MDMEVVQFSVADLFEETFHQTADDKSLDELPVNSPCGYGCQKVIEAGKAFMLTCEGAGEDMRDKILAIVEEAIGVYWRG